MMLSLAKRKLLTGAAISLSTAVIVNIGFHLGIFEGLEWKTFDFRVKFFNTKKHPPPDVALILVDEASLKAMNPVVGRWPWPRSIHADVIEFLAQGGAGAVAFDILFTENEKVFGAPPGALGDNDQRLVETTGSAKNVYHAAQFIVDIEDEYNKNLLNKPLPPDFAERFSVKGLKVPVDGGYNNNYYLPFPELYRVSKGIGVVEFSPDRDGIYRRTKLFRHYQGKVYHTLSTAPLLDALKPESIQIDKDRLTLSPQPSSSPTGGRNGRGWEIPLQRDGSYLINMYGNFKPYSISGILASIQKIKKGEMEGLPVSPEEFKDKIVFIGASAVGVEDLKATSIDNKTPGVFLHASIYGNIIQKDFLRYINPALTSFSIVALSLTVAFAILWIRSLAYQIGVPFLLALVYISTSFLWFKNNIVYDVVPPIAAIILSWMGAFAYLSFTEGKDKRKIKKMLGQYVSPTILAAVVDRSKQDVLKAEVGSKERLTILFSDIRGFTSISESLEAEKVVELLNGYLSEMVDVIFKHEGTLDKFIGDAIMAFWGAPVKTNDHGKRAVETAAEMMERLEMFNQGIIAKGLSPIGIGVGINTGDVILGNIGSEKKLDYTVIGDNVNLASRMEGLTKEYGCPVLITETTHEEVKDAILCRVVDIVRVKGKKKGIRIFEPIKAVPDIDRIVSLSEKGFRHYLNREWHKAKGSYSELLSLKPGDKLSSIFIDRCESYIENEPPKDWDGIYTMKSK